MFGRTSLIFFFAFFAQDLYGSLALTEDLLNILRQRGKCTPYPSEGGFVKPCYQSAVALLHLVLGERQQLIGSQDFRKIGSRYFYIETQEAGNWFSALNTCRRMGAQLATIRSRTELELIVPKLKWDVGYWLDVNDLAREFEFVSSSSGQHAPFLNWREGQPDNNNTNEYCVILINYFIYDNQCSEKRRFICEARDTF